MSSLSVVAVANAYSVNTVSLGWHRCCILLCTAPTASSSFSPQLQPEAQLSLDEMWKVLDSPALPNATSGGSTFFVYRDQLRKRCLQMAIRHDILPTAVILRDVQILDAIVASAGGFADVYCGTFRGDKVALKHLRVYFQKYRGKRSRRHSIVNRYYGRT